MQLFGVEKILVVSTILLAIIAGVSFFLQNIFGSQKIIVSGTSDVPLTAVLPIDKPSDLRVEKTVNLPEIIKAVYVSGYSAGSKKYLDYLDNLFKTTEINSVVVDIKGSNGFVSYNSRAKEVKKYGLYNGMIKDINALIRFFHDRNIYVIGRIAVFEDPEYSKARPELAVYNDKETTDLLNPVLWKDNNGLSWLDPASKDVWDYNISLAKDAFYHGFDEINFDYVRFPSDGEIENMIFPVWDLKVSRTKIITDFFQYLKSNLSGDSSLQPGKTSVDLFGQTTTEKNDMGIGQIIENAFENFDYISPMVYPSHYTSGFLGFENPAEHPYEVVKYSMLSAIIREKIFLKQKRDLATSQGKTEENTLAKFRPWLQDFNMGAYYTPELVKSEIKAVQEALTDEFNGFMLWNPSNIYTKEAVLKYY